MPGSRVAASALLALIVSSAFAQVPTGKPTWLPDDFDYNTPFFENASYDGSVATPKQILGFDIGDRPVRHAEIEKCFRAWEKSPRVKLIEFGRTHEGRALYCAVITSEANHKRLDDIRAAIAKLADPRTLRDDAEAQTIVRDTPAIAWLAYCIHGDELSGTDGALAVAYHLLACKDDAVAKLLDKTVICIDPLQNPDGRDRFIAMCDQSAGYAPNLDSDAAQHAGRWPRGRTNHYYFDMNRDWIYGTQPETRARQAAIVAWHPQLLVDGHEMGPESSFLFNPARDPFNPGLSPLIRKWWNLFADEAGKSFDRHGWSYYTREWADFWYPGYTDGWATLHGTIGILYEQARTGGRAVMLPTGRVLTYREAVHHQLTVTWSNLNTLLANREAVLTDYLAQRRAALKGDDVLPQTFLLPPQPNATRRTEFVASLLNQGLDVQVASAGFSAEKLTSSFRESIDKREFPAGTIIVHRRQPLGPLVEAALGFDPRMDKAFLDSERKELETKRNSRLYDITGWSPVMADALEAYWAAGDVSVKAEPYKPVMPATSMPSAETAYAFVLDGDDDASVRAVAHLLQADIAVRVCEKEFRAAGRSFSRGSFLVRRHENRAGFEARVKQAAQSTGATVHAALTARSPDDTPDLGGEHFFLLRRPRIALAGDGGGDTQTYGAIWHLLDRETGMGVSLVDRDLGGIDLRRYNVLIVPSASTFRRQLDDISTWVRAGGTLIAIGDAAEHLADEKLKLSEVRKRTDVLKALEEYASATALERGAGKTEVDADKLWDQMLEHVPPGQAASKPDTKLTEEALDEWRRIFSPTGAIFRGETSREHWLTFGIGPELPLFASGSTALLTKARGITAVRFAEPARLRLSGLLWPEAAARVGDSVYASAEHVGNGQIILFAQDPIFRGAWRGTGRLLLNAILLGPGCGASQPNP